MMKRVLAAILVVTMLVAANAIVFFGGEALYRHPFQAHHHALHLSSCLMEI